MKLPSQRILDWQRLQLRLLYCYQGRVNPHGWGEIDNPDPVAWLVKKGSAWVTSKNQRRIEIKTGQWIFIRPGKRIQEFRKNTELLSIGFTARYVSGESLFGVGENIVLKGGDYPQLERQARKIFAGLPDQSGYFTDMTDLHLLHYLAHQQSMMQWVAIWCPILLKKGYEIRSAHASDARVKAASEFVLQHLQDPHLTSKKISSRIGISVSQLNRLFLQDKGITLNEFYLRERLRQAKDLVLRSSLSIKEISFELGFKHPSHFTTWYRKHQGKTPSADKNKHVY